MVLRIALWIAVVLVGIVVLLVIVGWLLPKDHVASSEALIPAAEDRVASAILDVRRYPEWRSDLKAVDLLSERPLRWKEHGSNGVITYELQQQQGPHEIVVAIADPTLPFGGTWTYQLRAEDAGTRLSITERGEVRNPMFRFMSRFFFSPTATMEAYVAALQQRLR
jgi:hypothetical protein